LPVAGLLQQILGLLGLDKSPKRRRRPRQSPEALKRSGLVTCKGCQAPVRQGTPRCPQCGARVIEPPATLPSVAKLDLSDLQNKLLEAASTTESRSIQVLPPKGSEEGEVKAGSLRITGDDALTAVDQMCRAGLVEAKDDSSFVLTESGQKAVDRLAEPI